jgi:CheY-like chemotaxis protein
LGPALSSRPALLVVEDDDLLRDAVAFVLSGEGYEIVMARSGEEALALMGELQSLDGLYTDIQLSGPVTGWDVGEAFHQTWPTRPIVYASARDWPNARIMPTGVFLRKPIEFKRLIAVLAA